MYDNSGLCLFDWCGFVLWSVMLRVGQSSSSWVLFCPPVAVDGHDAMIHSILVSAVLALYNSYTLLIRLLSSSTVLIL